MKHKARIFKHAGLWYVVAGRHVVALQTMREAMHVARCYWYDMTVAA